MGTGLVVGSYEMVRMPAVAAAVVAEVVAVGLAGSKMACQGW
jgi:hypothetical protein